MKTRAGSRHLLFIIALLVLVFDGYGQEKVEQYNSNGLSTTIFKTSLGKVTVYLPEFSVNENISGTLIIEPFGNSDKKKDKNSVALKQYELSFGNQSILLSSETFKLSSSFNSSYQLQLLNNRGKVIATSNIQSAPSILGSNGSTHIPMYMVSGESTKIMADCDGNLANNSITISNNKVSILAESESGVFFKAPLDSKGSSQLQFKNDREIEEATVNILRLDLSVGRTNLLRGETTSLSINISGLEGLESDVPIIVTNNSSSNITLDGGNVQEFIVDATVEAPSGNYSKNVTIRALQRGNFSISVNVVPPAFNETISSSQELLCNCYINGQSYLITPFACEELGGHCSKNIEDITDFNEDETPPNFDFDLPEEITTEDGIVNLQIKDLKNNDCVAVVFSYRFINDEQWQFIGEDTAASNGLSFNWNPSIGNDRIYIIRAQVVNVNNITTERQQYVVFNITRQSKSDSSLNVLYSVSEQDIEREIRKARATGERIKKEEEKLRGMEDKGWDAEDRKKESETAMNELVVIDKVLDSIPKTYKKDFKRILDSLARLKKKLPDVIDSAVLQKAIDAARSRVDDCNKRLEALKKEQADLEEERDDLKDQLDAVQEAIYTLHIDNGWVGDYGYHPDGRPWHGYVGGERANVDLGDENYELKKQYRRLKKRYLKTLKRLGDLPSEILEAEEDCEALNKALEKAKTSKENTDLHAATELEAEDICRQIKRLLRSLRRWCHNNPDHCDFKEKLRKLLEECPKNLERLEAFWDELDDIITAKKGKENAFGKAADDNQDTIDAIDDDISGLEDKIKGLEDKQRKEFEAADKLRKQRAVEAKEAKARADAKAKEIRKQKKEDAKIKNLIKKAKSDAAGDEAFKNLLKGMGLDLLDEASGNLKLGKIIGGLLVIKDMPDCVCPLLTALRDAFVAKRNGRGGTAVYVEAYLLAWKKCANLPSISSVSIGGSELTKSINNMSNAQTDRAIKALNQAVRVQCK